jgi:alcohol dehydrogenase
LVDTYSTLTLLKLVSEGRLDPTGLTTHRFELNEIMEAYDVFADAANTNALKVTLSS